MRGAQESFPAKAIRSYSPRIAQMVTSEDVSTSLLIRKNRERGTFMRKRWMKTPRQVAADAPSQLQMLFSFEQQ